MMPEDSDREVAGILALVAVVFWLVVVWLPPPA